VSRTVIAAAPTRIDLAGGTLDIPPLYLFHQPACTVNVAIDLCACATVRVRRDAAVVLRSVDQRRAARWPDGGAIEWRRHPFLELAARLLLSFAPSPGLDVTTECQAPPGAGTGGSSALAIALAAALARLLRRRLGRAALIEYAKAVETQAIKVPTGYQDYVAAAYGGASVIRYGPQGLQRRPLGDARFLAELEGHLMLLYTGRPRFSGTNNWDLFKRHVDGDRHTWEFFDELRAHAAAMVEAFRARDVDAVAAVMQRDWETRRRMLPAMSTPAIDALARDCRRQGARAARLCGAGGGGCLALIVDPAARPRLEAVAARRGARVLPCRVNRRGLTVRALAR
jgi:D-glycero-alpha-D-manno-heptose-7-phosphate kinase